LAALITLRLLTLLTLSPGLILLAALRLLALLIAALGESALCAGRALFLTLAHALVHRLEAAHEVARAIRGLRLLALSVAGLCGGLRLLQALTEVRDVCSDLLFGRVHPVSRGGARLLLRVPKLLFDLAPAECVGRALERARHFALVALPVERHAIELGLEILHFVRHRALLLSDGLLQLLLRARVSGALAKLLHVRLHVLFLIGELLCRANRVGHIARCATRLFLIEQAPRFLKAVERLRRIAAFLAVRRGATHRVSRVLQSARSVSQRLILLLAREPLQLTRLLLGLLGEVALSLAARRA
jgi:hypothetical protein